MKEQIITMGELAEVLSGGRKLPEPERKPRGVLGKLRDILTRAKAAVAKSRLSEALDLLFDALDEIDKAEAGKK